MFTRLAKSGLANFRLAQLRRIAPRQHQAAFSNHQYLYDNLPGFRRPAAMGGRRSPTPTLACHWVYRDGRLECRWRLETNDTPSGAFDEHAATGQTSGLAPTQPRGRGLALAG